jgi:uncharacterized membrane protein
LFNTGVVYENAQDKYPTSLTLSQDIYKNSNIESVFLHYYAGYTFDANVYSSEWLSKYRHNNYPVYSDAISYWNILPSYGLVLPALMVYPDSIIKRNEYLYLSQFNTEKSLMEVPEKGQPYISAPSVIYSTSELPLDSMSKIYSNSRSSIFVK